jgi:pyruvate dehydrogenase E1 component alpha subunit
MTLPFDRPTALRIAERMLLMRRFEEKVFEFLERKLIVGLTHLYIGQEAGGAAVIDALGAEDYLLTNHRNHGHIVGRGADPGRAFADILGRATGLSGGRGGTVHLCDPSIGFLLTSAILGGNVSLALGAAYEIKRRGLRKVVAVFFGDGSLEEGVTLEVFNIAAMKKLPILFVLENNNLEALSMHAGGFSAANTSVRDFCDIPRLYGVAARQFTADSTLAAITTGAREAIAQCRAGDGPVFIELMSVRWPGGNMIWPKMLTGLTDLRKAWGDATVTGAHAEWTEKHDPVLRMAREFVAAGLAEKSDLLQVDREVSDRIEAAGQYALHSPYPPSSSAYDHVFA